MSEQVLNCPFCGWHKIRVVEATQRKGVLKGSKYTYGWCKVCGCQGPKAYNISDDVREVYCECIRRWNERQNGLQDE